MEKISKFLETKSGLKKQKNMNQEKKLFYKTNNIPFKNEIKSSETSPKLPLLNDDKKFRDKWPKIKSLSKEILYNSMAQAILNIIDTPYLILKIFLFICVLTSSAFSAYLVIQSFLAYFAYEVSTTTRTLSETPAPFPKVTICNYNPFTTLASIDFLRQINHLTRPDIDMFNETQLNKFSYRDKQAFFIEIYSSATSFLLSNTSVSDEYRKTLGHSLSDILISCSFNGYQCTANDFVWIYDRW